MKCLTGYHKTCVIPSKVHLWDSVSLSFIMKQCISSCSDTNEKYKMLIDLLRNSLTKHKRDVKRVAKNVEMIIELYQNIFPEVPNVENFECPPGQFYSTSVSIYFI